MAAGAALDKARMALPFDPGRDAARHVGETKHRFVALSATTPHNRGADGAR